MPVAVAPDDKFHSVSPDPSVVAGYVDCLKEALKFLLVRERLPPQHPIVAGLALHMARPGARERLRKLATGGSQIVPISIRRTEPSGSTREEKRQGIDGVSLSERSLHQVRNTSNIGKTRVPPVHKQRSLPVTNSVERHPNQQIPHTITNPSASKTNETDKQRNIAIEMRKNLQNIVENLQKAIDGSDDDEEDDEDAEAEIHVCNEDDVDDADTEEEEIDVGQEETNEPYYDTNGPDVDAEIDTILGDSVLRRELVRLVYQGCDLIATAPLQVPSHYPSPPSSPQYASIATPPQYLPQEHLIQHIENEHHQDEQ